MDWYEEHMRTFEITPMPESYKAVRGQYTPPTGQTHVDVGAVKNSWAQINLAIRMPCRATLLLEERPAFAHQLPIGDVTVLRASITAAGLSASLRLVDVVNDDDGVAKADVLLENGEMEVRAYQTNEMVALIDVPAGTPAGDYQGSIRLDGTELRDVLPESLYAVMSVIQQNVFVFNASIRDNVTMFRAFPQDALDDAIAHAHLTGLLAERGEAYRCGENGVGLSGGEKQRISIARTLLKKSSVLLADEATAALDAKTAHAVTSDLLDLTGMTRIIVTHNLEASALRRFDRILVMKDGRIEETGTFDELMAGKGYFYALFTVSQ